MKSYTVHLSNEEDKAMQYIAYDVQQWIDNAIHNRARQAIDKLILEHSDRQPKRINPDERNRIVREAQIKTVKQRQQEAEAELKGKK